MNLLLILFYFSFPIFILFLTHKVSFFNKVGAVVLAYAFGLLLGNIGLLPRASDEFKLILQNRASIPNEEALVLLQEGVIQLSDVAANEVAIVQDTISIVTIMLAIPLLLFSLDFRKWLKFSRDALFSLLLAMISLIVAIFAGHLIYRDLIDEAWKVTGLLIGLYTGGTPNLAAINTALEVDANTYLLTHTYDMVIGAVCLIFLMTVAQRIFNRFLPSFEHSHLQLSEEMEVDHGEDMNSFGRLLTRKGFIDALKAFGVAIIVVAIGGGISILVPGNAQMLAVILAITTFGILFSLWGVVNRIENSFQLGMYFIVVFSFAIASMGDLSNMFHVEYIHLFTFVAWVVFGSMAIHVFLSFLFKVDTDTTIITITALTYSPPFVPVVAGALKNKNVIISGLTVGLLGYAIGNYLGLAIAYFFQ